MIWLLIGDMVFCGFLLGFAVSQMLQARHRENEQYRKALIREIDVALGKDFNFRNNIGPR